MKRLHLSADFFDDQQNFDKSQMNQENQSLQNFEDYENLNPESFYDFNSTYNNKGKKKFKLDNDYIQNSNKFSKQYILSEVQLKRLLDQKKIYQINPSINQYQIYFPYPQLNAPQRILMKDIFQTLDNSGNILAQSSTGTGKTLTLLLSTLIWADKQYKDKKRQFQEQKQILDRKKYSKQIDNQIYDQILQILKSKVKKYKVIYTSRSHSQLSQIEKQLQKTPYRPNMLIFGSKQQLCVNSLINWENKKQSQKQNDQLHRKCNISVKYQKSFQKNPHTFNNALMSTRSTINELIKQSKATISFNKNVFNEQQKQWLNQHQKTIQSYLNNQIFRKNTQINKIKQYKFNDSNKLQKNEFNQKENEVYEKSMFLTFEYIEILLKKNQIPKKNREQLIKPYELLKDLQSRCQHFHLFLQDQKMLDIQLFRKIGRETLNITQLKKQALKFKPSICPYFYPKRVKNLGTLYLMPYNYLLDSKIMQSSQKLIQDAIIIFDQGHNVPNAACSGFSMQFKEVHFQMAISNINDDDQKRKGKDGDSYTIDIDQLEQQRLLIEAKSMRENSKNNKISSLQLGQNQQIDVKKSENRGNKQNSQNQKSQMKLYQANQLISKEIQFTQCIKTIKQHQRSFFYYFSQQKKQFLRPYDSQAVNLDEMKLNDLRFKFKQEKLVRFYHTSDSQKIQKQVKQIFFSEKKDQKINIKRQIVNLYRLLSKVILKKQQQQKFFFKILTFKNFYQRLHELIYNSKYKHKFYLEINQYAKFDTSLFELRFRGQIQIKCLDPSFAFKRLSDMNPKSIIIASGTLSPMNIFRQQIGLKLYNSTSAGYVITQDNIKTRIITKDLNNNLLKIDSSYFNFDNNNLAILKLLSQIIQKIPRGGVLVVLPSFKTIRQLEKFYRSQNAVGIRREIQKSKKFVDFQSKRSVQEIMKRFKIYANKKQGALLFCVVRAKLSQGIDFKDDLCRSLIFLGIPYLSTNDPFVKQKQRYLKEMKSSFAHKWKFIEASKAINQALGRTVRHAKDYGSILLIDSRYSQSFGNNYSRAVIQNISDWIRSSLKQNKNIHQLRSQLQEFYNICQTKFPFINTIQESQQQQMDFFKNRFNEQFIVEPIKKQYIEISKYQKTYQTCVRDENKNDLNFVNFQQSKNKFQRFNKLNSLLIKNQQPTIDQSFQNKKVINKQKI